MEYVLTTCALDQMHGLLHTGGLVEIQKQLLIDGAHLVRVGGTVILLLTPLIQSHVE